MKLSAIIGSVVFFAVGAVSCLSPNGAKTNSQTTETQTQMQTQVMDTLHVVLNTDNVSEALVGFSGSEEMKPVGVDLLRRFAEVVGAAEWFYEWNDGRMMRMVTPDYTVMVKYEDEQADMSIVMIWSSGVVSFGGHWYKLPEGKLAEVAALLDSCKAE